LRGFHCQTENTQRKFVRVVSGEVFGVAVDVRKDSPKFEEAEFVYKCMIIIIRTLKYLYYGQTMILL
jgi:dTDP-4-dehydrorhamnose 3,5-epimerase-like enzyme